VNLNRERVLAPLLAANGVSAPLIADPDTCVNRDSIVFCAALFAIRANCDRALCRARRQTDFAKALVLAAHFNVGGGNRS
jgi:hypothetical protein